MKTIKLGNADNLSVFVDYSFWDTIILRNSVNHTASASESQQIQSPWAMALETL